jgi:hypothetical protein
VAEMPGWLCARVVVPELQRDRQQERLLAGEPRLFGIIHNQINCVFVSSITWKLFITTAVYLNHAIE